MPPDIPAEGGGATTFEPTEFPMPLREPRGLLLALVVPMLGGGGTTLAARPVPVPPAEPFVRTTGGGGTTSVGPKILPIRLLINEPLPDCEGGGGTISFDGSGMLPLARRCLSGETSVDGGGATTDDAGKLNLELRLLARSGAEAGGGTTAAFVIITGELESSLFTPPGAGGITFAASAALVRARLPDTVGAGATTELLRVGAFSACSRATFGAGGITAGPSAGATRV